jgi:FkbM family methyltransferase
MRDSTRDAAERTWKMRAGARARQVAMLKQRIAELEQHLPTPDVLRQALALRARQMPIASDERQAAAARDARLREVSPEYRAALEDRDDPALEKVAIDGLDWWVPLDPRVDSRVERAQRQGFPLRAILQTRELALGGVMLDLGANIGRTCIPRVLLGDVRAVYAAEPFPANFAALARNVREYRLEGFVLPDQVAIGAERGVVDLRVSLYPGGHRVLYKRRRPVDTISVAVWPVDEWIARIGVEPEAISFVKVDTQGSDVRVLEGAASLLDRAHIAWQLEVDPVLLKRAGTPLRDLCALAEAHFSHFIDMGGHIHGPRSRAIATLREALHYLGLEQGKTDVIFYHALP